MHKENDLAVFYVAERECQIYWEYPLLKGSSHQVVLSGMNLQIKNLKNESANKSGRSTHRQIYQALYSLLG